MNLYEIDKTLERLLDLGDDWVDEETGEILTYQEVAAMQMARDKKIEGWGLWIKNRRADIAALKAEIDALRERLKALDAKVEHSTQRYQAYLAGERVETPRLSVSYRRSQETMIDDPEKLPTKYVRTKTETSPDKTAIRAAIKAGETVPGARLADKVSMLVK